MASVIPLKSQAIEEALKLSAEIINNIERDELQLINVAYKVYRLACLLNETEMQKICQYEIKGYPLSIATDTDILKLAIKAGRLYEEQDSTSNEPKRSAYHHSIEELQEILKTLEKAFSPNNLLDRDFDLPFEVDSIQQLKGYDMIRSAKERIESRRSLFYEYSVRTHYELKFSGIADDIFSRIRSRVDSTIGEVIPDAVQKLTSAYENLRSKNPEDWANAVHSCRRILVDLADAVFPPTDEVRTVKVGDKKKEVKLGKGEYINRLMAFIQDSSDSERFQEIVGSHLEYLGNRLDSIVEASHKGTHSTVKKEEADRYVVYTYLLVGDILSLHEPPSEPS